MSAMKEHPARALFDSNFDPGMLSRLVREAREREPDRVFDADEVIATFEAFSCPETAKFVHGLKAVPEMLYIGSGSISMFADAQGEFTLEKAMSLQELYIGSVKSGLKPLAWMGYLSLRMDDVPIEFRPFLERLMKEFITFLTIPTGTSNTNLDGDLESSIDD